MSGCAHVPSTARLFTITMLACAVREYKTLICPVHPAHPATHPYTR